MIRNSSPHRHGFNMGIVQNLGAQLIGALAVPILLVQISERINWHAAFYVPLYCVRVLIISATNMSHVLGAMVGQDINTPA